METLNMLGEDIKHFSFNVLMLVGINTRLNTAKKMSMNMKTQQQKLYKIIQRETRLKKKAK